MRGGGDHRVVEPLEPLQQQRGDLPGYDDVASVIVNANVNNKHGVREEMVMVREERATRVRLSGGEKARMRVMFVWGGGAGVIVCV